AFGGERALAASGACALKIVAKTAAGPHKDTAYSGTLNLTIGDNGAIDAGSFDRDDGSGAKLVGQATGRALNLRITLADKTVLELNGTAENDLILCRGAASGTFGGPGDMDFGTWRTVDGGSSGTSSGAAGGGSGNSAGGGSGDGNAPGGADCPSGVVCAGVCCQPAAGLTPDSMVCNAGACDCTYSCAAAGCGGGDGSIVNTCGSDPQPHCHSECNVPADTGCGDMACTDGTRLNPDTCTCDPTGGATKDPCGGTGWTDCSGTCADLSKDGQNCGSCGNFCGTLMVCSAGSCVDVCALNGLLACGGTCVNATVDPNNCGVCGLSCAGRSPLGVCFGGQCA
ncbi:MAG: hypothetical protein ACR2OO_10220, partial [Thermomicrobiales bacterium]